MLQISQDLTSMLEDCIVCCPLTPWHTNRQTDTHHTHTNTKQTHTPHAHTPHRHTPHRHTQQHPRFPPLLSLALTISRYVLPAENDSLSYLMTARQRSTFALLGIFQEINHDPHCHISRAWRIHRRQKWVNKANRMNPEDDRIKSHYDNRLISI